MKHSIALVIGDLLAIAAVGAFAMAFYRVVVLVSLVVS